MQYPYVTIGLSVRPAKKKKNKRKGKGKADAHRFINACSIIIHNFGLRHNCMDTRTGKKLGSTSNVALLGVSVFP